MFTSSDENAPLDTLDCREQINEDFSEVSNSLLKATGMTLRNLLAVVWKRRIVVVLVLVFCVGGGALFAFSKPQKNYESSATIAFLPNPRRPEILPSEAVSVLLSTYGVVAESEKTLAAAGAILGHPVQGSVTATTASDGWVLGISSEAARPEAAAETVRAVIKALIRTIPRNGIVIPNIINSPAVSSAPIESRSPGLIISVAAVLGLIAGFLFALLLENLAGPPESPAELPD